VVDADLKSYFDTIDHERLMERVKEQVSDGRVLELIEAYLHQDIIKEMERWTPVGGTPQGAVISPLLANIYLHALDCQIKQKGYQMVRYADDFVVLCRSAEQAQAALAEVKAWVEANGLSLNAEKTHVGDCRQEGQGLSSRLSLRGGTALGEEKEPQSVARANHDEDQTYMRGQLGKDHEHA